MLIQVLNEAMNESLSLSYDDSLENISIPEKHSTETSKETRNKNVQVDLHPPQITRSRWATNFIKRKTEII